MGAGRGICDKAGNVAYHYAKKWGEASEMVQLFITYYGEGVDGLLEIYPEFALYRGKCLPLKVTVKCSCSTVQECSLSLLKSRDILWELESRVVAAFPDVNFRDGFSLSYYRDDDSRALPLVYTNDICDILKDSTVIVQAFGWFQSESWYDCFYLQFIRSFFDVVCFCCCRFCQLLVPVFSSCIFSSIHS
jgi:hypothetical protein